MTTAIWFISEPVFGNDSSFKNMPLTESTPYHIDIIHQDLHLNVDPSVRYISGFVQTTFKASQSRVGTISLDLHSDLQIDSIKGQSGLKLLFTRNSNHTTDIRLEDTLAIDQITSISIFYQGIPPDDGLGSFVQSTHATGDIIWTLSEPYGARVWWPCGQNLSDKIDSLDLWITVPSGQLAASNGLLLSESNSGNTTVFHWQHRYPIATYLVALAVTNYKIHEMEIPLQNGPLPVVNYLYPQDFDRHRTQIEAILPDMMQLFEKLFIPYPFDREKYGHAQFGYGGGMEHQTMSFMFNFGYELTAHELAHQWFGDYVTCGSWEDIWLNEGFASYLSGLTYEQILQNGRWENFLYSYILDITSQPGGSLLVADTTDFNLIFNSRLSYKKGAMVLHMLRWILGDENFFEGIRQYLLDDQTQYAFARTRHLMEHLEKTSGIDLEEFFRDWYVGEGFPSYAIQWESTDSGVSLKVNQTSSHSSVSFFEIPLEVGLYGTNRDTLIRLDIQENGTVFSIPLSWTVDSVSIDPRYWIISSGNTTKVMATTGYTPQKEEYSIYPNPAKNSLTIENQGSQVVQRIYMYNVTGQVVDEFEKIIELNSSATLQLKKMVPGMYYLVIETKSGSLTNQKIMIQ